MPSRPCIESNELDARDLGLSLLSLATCARVSMLWCHSLVWSMSPGARRGAHFRTAARALPVPRAAARARRVRHRARLHPWLLHRQIYYITGVLLPPPCRSVSASWGDSVEACVALALPRRCSSALRRARSAMSQQTVSPNMSCRRRLLVRPLLSAAGRDGCDSEEARSVRVRYKCGVCP
jgi:hypothetical protein